LRASAPVNACAAPKDEVLSGDREQRAEHLLGQLQQWAMEAMELPREQRDDFIVHVAAQYHEDALKNGLTADQADEWRENIDEWLHSLVDVIETSGGAAGGNA
jgi:hypothetical protein